MTSNTYNNMGRAALVGICSGKISYCSVTNVIVDAIIQAGLMCGSLIPINKGDAVINDCFVSGVVNSGTSGFWSGLLCGYLSNHNATIERCISKGELKLGYQGGSFGHQYNGTEIIRNCIAIGDKINASNNHQIGRIASGDKTINCYSVNFPIGREAKSNKNEKDGETISIEQSKSKEFYKLLGFDFDGVTQEDGKAVWKIDENDDSPKIIRPFKTFKEENQKYNTGQAIATTLIIEKYKNNQLQNNYPKHYNIINEYKKILFSNRDLEQLCDFEIINIIKEILHKISLNENIEIDIDNEIKNNYLVKKLLMCLPII